MAEFDAVIVGAGPAGSALATWLGRRGHRILLVDRARFPRDKVCGECLVPGAIALLHDLGVAPALVAAGATPVRGLRLVGPDEHAVETPYPDGLLGYTLSRVALDAALLDRARQTPGVTVLEGCKVVGLPDEPRGVRLETGDEHRARVVVGADGRFSLVRRLAFGPDELPRAERFCFINTLLDAAAPDDYLECGLVDSGLQYLRAYQGQGRYVMCLCVDTAVRDAHAPGTPEGFLALVRQQPRLAKVFADARLAGPMKGMPLTPYGSARLVADGVLLAGDAVGFMDPITGEGMCRALHSAALAADTLDRALTAPHVTATSLRGYETALRRQYDPVTRFADLTMRFTTLPSWAARPCVRLFGALPAFAGAYAAVQAAMVEPDALFQPHRWPVWNPGQFGRSYSPLQ